MSYLYFIIAIQDTAKPDGMLCTVGEPPETS